MKDFLCVLFFLVLNGLFVWWIVEFEKLKRDVENQKANHIARQELQNDLNTCKESRARLSECGPSQKVEDGQCKIDFEGEKDAVFDLCTSYTFDAGGASITDLQNYTKQGQKIPRMIQVGYKNGRCNDQMYSMYTNQLK